MDWWTHVATGLVGALLALIVLRPVQQQSTKSADSSTTAKKKKKKKSKKAPSSTTAGEEDGTAKTAKSTPPPTEIKSQQPPKPNDAPVPPTTAASKKTKKKKSKAKPTAPTSSPASTTATTPVAPDPAAPSSVVPEPAVTTTTTAVAPPAPAPQPPVQEEVWSEAVSNKRKKKKSKPAAGTGVTTFITPQTAKANGNTATNGHGSSQKESESLRVTVDPTKVGIVIGPKGTTLQALQAATGCTLNVHAPPAAAPGSKSANQRKPGEDAVVVIADGDATSRATAKAAVRELVTKGYTKLLQGDDFTEHSILVHPRHLSEIVGPGGRTIKALQGTLNVKIRIPATDWKPNAVQVGKVPPMAKVGIAGDKAQAQKAREVITALTQYHHHDITHPGLIHEEVYVPAEFVHCVIGARGSEIKHIKGNYQVDVYMPQDDSITSNVIVVGKQRQVDQAISYIQTLMERDSEQRERKYHDEYY